MKLITRGDHFLFGSVFIKKSNRIKFFKKKNRNRTETGSNRPVSVWFGFFREKTGSNRFGSVLARFFLVWLGFFPGFFLFRFGSVFCLQNRNRTGRFFQNFNRFFFFCFFGYFFFRFSRFNNNN